MRTSPFSIFNTQYAHFYAQYCGGRQNCEPETRTLPVLEQDMDTMLGWKQEGHGTATLSVRDSIILGVSRRMAGASGMWLIEQPTLTSPSGVLPRAYELPAYDPLPETADLGSVTLSLHPGVFALLDWSKRERGVAPEQTIHDGMALIGAVAMRPFCRPVIGSAPPCYFESQGVSFERFMPELTIPDTLPADWQ